MSVFELSSLMYLLGVDSYLNCRRRRLKYRTRTTAIMITAAATIPPAIPPAEEVDELVSSSPDNPNTSEIHNLLCFRYEYAFHDELKLLVQNYI